MKNSQIYHVTRITLLAFIMTVGLYHPQAMAEDQENPVVAVIDGAPISQQQVISGAAKQFEDLEKRYQREYKKERHALMEQRLNQLIEDQLVEKEAAARNVPKDQVLADIKAAEPTQAEVDAFYEQNKARIPQPKEQVAPQIKNYLQQQSMANARKAFFDALRAKHKVELLLSPLRTEVAATGPSKGPAVAPITIVEFSDFECPFCSRLNPTLDQVLQKYGDKVRLVFRQYPLAMHKNAQKAAEASLCANEQGKFWDMHDHMFQNQKALSTDQLKAKAAELGINAEQFNACLDSSKFAETVAKDMQDGTDAGVSGTPALFVNGRFISGAVPLENITSVVDDELKRKGITMTP